MKKLIYIIVLVAALAAGQALAVQVTQIALSYENGATVARVTADGPFQLSHQTEVPKDGKGDRMILDLIGATTGLSQKNFTDLPNCGIVGIRTGQYAVTPEKVVRVVFDFAKAPVYQVERQGNCVKITFTDKAVTAFSAWSSDAARKAAQPAPTPKPVVATVPAATPVTTSGSVPPSSAARVTETDRLASLSSNAKPVQPPTPAATSTPTNNTVKIVSVDNKPVMPTVATPAPTPTAPNPVKVVSVDSKPVTPTVATPTASSVKVVTVDNPKTPAPTTPVPSAAVSVPNKPLATENPKPTTPVTTIAAPATPIANVTPKPVVQTAPVTPAPVAPKSTSEPTKIVTPSPTVAVKPVQPEVKPAVPATTAATPPTGNQIQQALSAKPSPAAAAEKPASSVTAPTEQTPSKPIVLTPMKPVEPAQPKPAVTPAVSAKPDAKPATEPATVVASAPVGTTPSSDTKQQPATGVTIPRPLTDDEETQVAEADDAENANPDLPANKATSRFRRSAVSDAKIKGTMVAEFPQRLVVKYEALGNRDPFATLIDDSRTYNTPVENRVPNIDGLRLVGIIESERGASDNRALFEDKNGYSYILSSGDKVQRGYVLRVEDDRVYFQIFEYGWSRTVALAIENAN